MRHKNKNHSVEKKRRRGTAGNYNSTQLSILHCLYIYMYINLVVFYIHTHIFASLTPNQLRSRASWLINNITFYASFPIIELSTHKT